MDTEHILLKKFKEKQRSTKGRIDKLGNPIEFKLTFEEWKNLWNSADRLPGYPYVVSRKNDIGHYEIDNVYINHNLMNVTESLTKNNEVEQRISQICIETGYKRQIVKRLIKAGKIKL